MRDGYRSLQSERNYIKNLFLQGYRRNLNQRIRKQISIDGVNGLTARIPNEQVSRGLIGIVRRRMQVDSLVRIFGGINDHSENASGFTDRQKVQLIDAFNANNRINLFDYFYSQVSDDVSNTRQTWLRNQLVALRQRVEDERGTSARGTPSQPIVTPRERQAGTQSRNPESRASQIPAEGIEQGNAIEIKLPEAESPDFPLGGFPIGGGLKIKFKGYLKGSATIRFVPTGATQGRSPRQILSIPITSPENTTVSTKIYENVGENINVRVISRVRDAPIIPNLVSRIVANLADEQELNNANLSDELAAILFNPIKLEFNLSNWQIQVGQFEPKDYSIDPLDFEMKLAEAEHDLNEFSFPFHIDSRGLNIRGQIVFKGSFAIDALLTYDGVKELVKGIARGYFGRAVAGKLTNEIISRHWGIFRLFLRFPASHLPGPLRVMLLIARATFAFTVTLLGTVIVTGGAMYAIERAHRAGRQDSYLNWFSYGMIDRLFYGIHRQNWLGPPRTEHQRRAHSAGRDFVDTQWETPNDQLVYARGLIKLMNFENSGGTQIPENPQRIDRDNLRLLRERLYNFMRDNERFPEIEEGSAQN